MLSARGSDHKPFRETAVARFGDDRAPLREVGANLPAVRPQSQASGRQAHRDDWAVKASPFREELLDTRSRPSSGRTEEPTGAPPAVPPPGAASDANAMLGQSECDRLRAHCEELLRLNAILRQQQLDVTMGTYSGKFDNLLREFSQMRGFQQSLRTVVEMSSQSRKDLKDLQDTVSPISSKMSELVDVALDQVKASLRDEVRDVVKEEMGSLREQLTRIHENSTRMVSLTLSNRKDFEEHRFALSSGKVDEIWEVTRENKEMLISNCSKLEATWELVQSNKKSIDRNAETILSNKRSIEENRGFIQSNKDLIKEEQEKAQAEAVQALEKVHALQDELRNQEHTLAEKARIEREIWESQRHQDAMEEEMNRLQDELQEGMKEEMDDMNSKIQSMLDAVGKLLERIDHPQDDLAGQLRAVAEIQRRGNLEINLHNGNVKLKRGIVFKRRNPGDEPDAQFENQRDAKAILKDIADLWQMVSVPVVVEGHTKDIGGGSEQFWQQVADNRASLCAATLAAQGVDPQQIVAVGKPGKSGLNKAALVIHFDIFPDLH